MSRRPQYHENTFKKGMNKDLSPHELPANTYQDAVNLVEITEEGDFLERIVEKGTLELPGKVVSSSSPGTLFRIIGHVVLGKEIVVFSVSDDGTLSEIGILDAQQDYGSVLTTDELNFSIEHEIEAKGRIYFNGDRIVYWVDDYNTPRFLNLDDVPTSSIADNTDLFISQKPPVARFSRTLEKQGTIEAGAYQFIPRYLDDTLNPTFFGIITNPIGVSIDFREAGRSQYDGDVQGRTTAKSLEITVENIDTDFPFLELVVITRNGPAGIPQAFKIQRKETQEGIDTETFVFSGLLGDEEEVSIDEIILRRPSYNKAKCIEQIDSRIALSNLETTSEEELQEIANQLSIRYSVNEILYQDSTPTTDITTGAATTAFEVFKVYFQPDADEEADDVKNLNLMVFEFSHAVDPATTADQVGLIKTALTGGVFVNVRVTPSTISVDGNRITADFGASVDFSDDTVWNFTDFELIDSTLPDHLELTTWGVGSDLDAISGGPTADVVKDGSVDTVTATGPSYASQQTSTVTETAGVVVVDLVTIDSDISASIAVYGTNHNTTDVNLFEVLTIDNADESLITIGSSATGNDPALTPTITQAVAGISEKGNGSVQATGELLNDSYFGDYVDEGLATDYRTFMRNEVYSLAVTFLYKNGGVSSPFHIPGKLRTGASVAIKDIPSWIAQAYAISDEVTWLGSVYRANAVTTASEDPSNTPAKWNYQRDASQEGWCGTYESIEEYVTAAGFPSSTGSGADYSKNGRIRHHRMPTNEEEPLYKLAPDSRLYIRLLGLIPVWDDGGVIKSIEDLISSSSLAGVIDGFIIGREKRDSVENRSIVMQGLGQSLWEHKGGNFTAHEDDTKKPHISNSYFFGKTRLNIDEKRIYPRHDRRKQFIGYTHEEQRKDLVQFYSPDVDLLDREIPAGAVLQPVLGIFGSIEQITLAKPKARRRGPVGGLAHLFCSYNGIEPLELAGATDQTILSATAAKFADNTFEWAFTDVEGVNRPIANYYNEGYTLLDLGEGNELPEHKAAVIDVQYNLSIDKGEFGSGFNADNSFIEAQSLSSYTDFKSERALYNVVLDNQRQYGDLGSAVYINCGVFPARSAVVNPEDAIFYGGDTFISKYSYKNSGTWRWAFNSKSSASFADSSETKVPYALNARQLGTSGGEGEELRSLAYFFVESEVNCNWRHRQVEEQVDGSYQEIGAEFYPHEPKITGIFERSVTITGVGEFKGFSYPDSVDDYGVLDYDPGLGQATGYNKSYSAQDDLGVQIGRPFGFTEITDYPNRTIYSDSSIEGETSDKFRLFRANNFHDIPQDSGEITNTFIQGNVFYMNTVQKIFRAFVNERTAVPTSEGELILGNGGMFPLPSKALLDLEGGHAGLQHQFAFTQTPYGAVWVDESEGKLYRLSGQETLEEITLQGMMSWFAVNIKQTAEEDPTNYRGSWEAIATYTTTDVVKYLGRLYDVSGAPPAGTVPSSVNGEEFYSRRDSSTYQDNPSNPDAQGIRLGYDKSLRRVLITKRDTENPFTLSYSLLTNAYVARHTYLPTRYMSVGNKLYGVDNIHTDAEGLRIYEHNKGSYGVFYHDSVQASEITVVVNVDFQVEKVFDNLIILSESYSEEGVEQVNDTFDLLQAYTTNKHTGLIQLVPGLDSLNMDLTLTRVTRVNDEFRVTLPKDMVIDKAQDIFDSANLNLSLPITDPRRLDLPKMKGKYLILRLVYNNADNNKFGISSILSKRGVNDL